jgi:hypothetical protein
MKIRVERDETPQEVKQVIIYIGEDRYTCKESFGRLEITKISDGDSDIINVQPRSGNQIDLF